MPTTKPWEQTIETICICCIYISSLDPNQTNTLLPTQFDAALLRCVARSSLARAQFRLVQPSPAHLHCPHGQFGTDVSELQFASAAPVANLRPLSVALHVLTTHDPRLERIATSLPASHHRWSICPTRQDKTVRPERPFAPSCHRALLKQGERAAIQHLVSVYADPNRSATTAPHLTAPTSVRTFQEPSTTHRPKHSALDF